MASVERKVDDRVNEVGAVQVNEKVETRGDCSG